MELGLLFIFIMWFISTLAIFRVAKYLPLIYKKLKDIENALYEEE